MTEKVVAVTEKTLHLRFAMEHAVTDYDMKAETAALKRRAHYNIYALPQMLAAVDRAMGELANGSTLESALSNNFDGRLLAVVTRAATASLARR